MGVTTGTAPRLRERQKKKKKICSRTLLRFRIN
jgi:hypothetical protein